MAEAGPESIVFVGGAPRSGTSVTHALICSAATVSRYSPEISFFRFVPRGFRSGRLTWKQHTSGFFDDLEQYRAHMRRVGDIYIEHIWKRLGSPPILALKDPDLTPFFPDVRLLFPDIARFVTVIRHPFEVVRSRQDIQEGQLKRAITREEVTAVAQQYRRYYDAVLNTNFGGRHLVFRYENLNDEDLHAALARFIGVEKLNERPMWGEAWDLSTNPFFSPKFFQPIDLTPRLSPLAPEFREVVQQICGPLMERFGYD